MTKRSGRTVACGSVSIGRFLGGRLALKARFGVEPGDESGIALSSGPPMVLGHGGDKKKRRELREAAKAAEAERRSREREDNPAKFYEDISEAEVERLSKIVHWPGVNQP